MFISREAVQAIRLKKGSLDLKVETAGASYGGRHLGSRICRAHRVVTRKVEAHAISNAIPSHQTCKPARRSMRLGGPAQCFACWVARSDRSNRSLHSDAQAGLAPEGRPVGVVLLLGPTGTGKTRTVDALAELLHGSSKNLLKVDCGEFQMEHEVAKLIGAPRATSDTDQWETRKPILLRQKWSSWVVRSIDRHNEATAEKIDISGGWLTAWA